LRGDRAAMLSGISDRQTDASIVTYWSA